MKEKRRRVMTKGISMLLVLLLMSTSAYANFETAALTYNRAENPFNVSTEEEEMRPFVDLAEESDSLETDRFIIKYKENTDRGRVKSKGLERVKIAEETAKGSADVKIKKTSKLQTKDGTEIEKYEMITLEKAVNPALAIAKIEENLDMDEVEYVQPDHRMTMSDITISVDVSGEEFVEIPTELPIIEEPEPSDPPEETVSPEPSGEPSTEPSIEASEESEPIVPAAGSGVIVAIVDTGIDGSHQDLFDRILTGWNFTDGTDDTFDEQNAGSEAHGTHIAGIVASVAPEVSILPIKVFKDGFAYTSDIIAAIEYAKENGASIVNFSFGSTGYNPALMEAMEGSGLTFVCAAGNSRLNLMETPVYPASFAKASGGRLDNVISVASVNDDGGISYFSNYGGANIAAAGRDIYSTLPGDSYGNMTGTSMSAGFVTGALAVLEGMETENDNQAQAVLFEGSIGAELPARASRLFNGADKLSNLEGYVEEGRRLNVQDAVAGLVKEEVIQNSPDPDYDTTFLANTPGENFELFSTLINVQVAAGFEHSLALKADGSVWAWGQNDWGQLGRPLNATTEPQVVQGLPRIKYIAAGFRHSVAIDLDGNVWAWGSNQYGQCGTTTNYGSSKYVPSKVDGINNVKKVSAGTHHTLALKTNGEVWAWGYNHYGELGVGDIYYRSYPIQSQTNGTVIDISAGYFCSTAITENNIYSWGRDVSGQFSRGITASSYTPVAATGITGPFKQIATGYDFTVVLKEDGTVWSAGYNGVGQFGNGTQTHSATFTQATSISGVETIDAEGYFAIAIKNDKSVWATGGNWTGQLGTATRVHESTYIELVGEPKMNQISLGYEFSLGLGTDGKVLAWGSNGYGQVSVNSPDYEKDPIAVDTFNDIVQVSTGFYHSIALKADGSVWSWGLNQNGQIGDGTAVNATAPIKVIGLKDIVYIAAGYHHNLAVKKDGTVWAWGYNVSGQLGDDSYQTKRLPIKVKTLKNIEKVSAGNNSSFAISKTGELYAWGDSGYSGMINQKLPTLVSEVANAADVACGYVFQMASTTDGEVYAWGDNSNGQLGLGDNTNRNVPVKIPSFTNVEQIAAGYYHSVAIKSDGSVWAWGYNGSGQLGDGSNVKKNTPTLSTLFTDTVEVSCGEYSTMFRKTDGSVRRTSGANATIELLAAGSGAVQISAGVSHNAVVKEDGGVWTTGSNAYGQLGIGNTTDQSVWKEVKRLDAVQIAAGDRYSLALDADGRVWAWGKNDAGQLGLGDTINRYTPTLIQSLSNITQIVAGESHNLALDADGKVWAWGWNDHGQLGDGTTTNASTPAKVKINGVDFAGVTYVAAGKYLSAAVTSDGKVWKWGEVRRYDGYSYQATYIPVEEIDRYTGQSFTTASKVFAGGYAAIVVRTDGSIYGMGENWYAQYANNAILAATQTYYFDGVNHISDKIALSTYHGAGIDTSGNVYRWGSQYSENIHGDPVGYQVMAIEGKTATDVTAGWCRSVFVLEDGSVWEAGYYDRVTIPLMQTFPDPDNYYERGYDLTGMVGVAAGVWHTLAFDEDGNIYAWGDNVYGQLGATKEPYTLTPTPDKTPVNDFFNVTIDSPIYIDYTTNTVIISGNVIGSGNWVICTVEGPTNSLEWTGNTSVINGRYEIQFELLNPVQDGTYTLSVKAEGMDNPINRQFTYDVSKEVPGSTTVSFNANIDEAVFLTVNGVDIKQVEEVVMEIRYDANQLEIDDLLAQTYIREPNTVGTYDNIQFTTVQPGIIQFKLVNKQLTTSQVWSGVFNIVKFKAKQTGICTATVRIKR